jgi:CheY-like chemotaxis protein
MHLLYVDDDRINLLLFENACAELPGLTLSMAASGAEALEAAGERRPQLLVIDLHLPDTDGHALLQRLRQDAGLMDVPAFLCSADDPTRLLPAALDAGFRGCWAKPVDSRMLRHELQGLGLPTAVEAGPSASPCAGTRDVAAGS